MIRLTVIYQVTISHRVCSGKRKYQQLIQSQAQKAKSAMRVLSRSSADVRNHALLAMAESLQNSKDKIANRINALIRSSG